MTYIVILLIVVIAALFVDWGAVSKRVPWLANLKRPSVPRIARTGGAPKIVSAEAVSAPTNDRFPMEEFVPAQNDEPKAVTGDPEVDAALAEADIHFRKGEMKAAEKLYLQAAAKDPKCSKAYARLGVIYLENGDDWDDAEAAFRQALKFDQNNGYILNNLGLVLYHQDKYADAIRNFEAAVRLDEQNASRHANLGMAYMAMRQYAKAESSFKKALKLQPNEMEYKDLLAEAMEKKSAHKAMLRK